MARRALALREGKAPIRDRLLTMIFLAALLHGLIILGLTFNVSGPHGIAPGLEVLLVSDEVPEADKNDSATYLAQRSQLGSGNTREAVAPRNKASSIPIPTQDGTPDGNALGPKGDESGNPQERVLTTSGWNVQVHYLAEPGNAGSSRNDPLLLEQQKADQPGPNDEAGPAQLRGPSATSFGLLRTPRHPIWRPIWTRGDGRLSASARSTTRPRRDTSESKPAP